MPIISNMSGPIDQIINVTKTVVEHLSSQLPVLNEEQIKERKSICQECEFYEKFTNRCKQCGCWMVVKMRLPLAKCPIKKWDVHPDAQKIINEHTKDTDVKIGECQNCPQQKQ